MLWPRMARAAAVVPAGRPVALLSAGCLGAPSRGQMGSLDCPGRAERNVATAGSGRAGGKFT